MFPMKLASASLPAIKGAQILPPGTQLSRMSTKGQSAFLQKG